MLSNTQKFVLMKSVKVILVLKEYFDLEILDQIVNLRWHKKTDNEIREN